MNYTLMHKNIPVVDLLIAEDSGFIEKIGFVHSITRLPIGTTGLSKREQGIPERARLNDWWQGRSIPASRENIQSALYRMRLLSPITLLSKCFGLSLSDQYWIRPLDLELEWANVNFFQNDFSNDVGEILFGHEPKDAEHINLMSPDNTSDGWLKKKWIISEGTRFLMKGGSGPYQQEPLNERIAYAVMSRLNIPHVPYTLTFQDELPYSLCQTFITPDTELVPAWRVIQTLVKDNKDSDFAHLLRCCDQLGISNVQASLNKMLVLDYLIANTDRHYNNFGFVRNVETLEWHGLAPIYDSGTSMWHSTQFVGRSAESKPFKKTHLEQIALVQEFSWFDVKKLDGIREECADIFAQSPLISKERRMTLLDALDENIGRLGKRIK
ncbi:MAG: HipA domain-containing protein [Clostridiales bacterium]|nr:HipA domain-containing protein [Clostridiales bacterium]